MNFAWAILSVIVLFVGILACLRAGWWLGRRHHRITGEGADEGLGAVEGAVFGLMGLLIAFTFTGAADRFDDRRALITHEVNAIGTAWLRLDLLPDAARDSVRNSFREYLDARIKAYRELGDDAARTEARAAIATIQEKIWTQLQAAVREDRSMPIAQTVLPPVNEMFDIAEERYWVTKRHPAFAIFVILTLLILISALLAGFGMAKAPRQSLLHLVGFAAVTAVALYLIVDLEFPRLGFVRVDAFDRELVELRAWMK
jgi:hypothetical protein